LHSQISSLKNIINDLHALNESDLGSLKYRMKKVNLSNLLEQSFNNYLNKFNSKNIEFDHSIKENIIVQGDINRLHQLMNNLFQNSLHYTRSGGKIKLSLKKENDKIIMNLSDSEPGLNKDQRDKIFDRWYRVDSSRNRNTGGTGLGLSICKAIAQAHNAEIYAESSELGGLKIIIEWKE